MRRGQGFLLGAALTVLAAWPAGLACGTTITGKSSTVIEWYDTTRENTALPVYQYLTLNASDLGGQGYNFRGYGRLGADLNDEVDADSRLYYGYLDKTGFLTSKLDCRLGRQFIANAAGASILDGIALRYRDVGPLTFSMFGGGDMAFYKSYEAQDTIFGGEVNGSFFNGLDLGISYIQKWGDGELTHEVIGFTGDYDLLDQLDIYTDLQYSWLTAELTYGLAGVKYHRSPQWGLSTEYLYSLPVFSSTSIYSVFAVAKYEQGVAEFDYRLAPGLRAFGRYTHEMYEDYEDADVYEIGIEQIRVKRFSGYLISTRRQSDDSQHMRGCKARVGYLLNRFLDAGIGAHYDVLERRLDIDDDDTTARRYWVDMTAYLTKKIDLQAKVERIESDLWQESYQGRVRLNIKF